MKMKKFDFTQIKDILLAKGERLALAGMGVVAFLLVVVTLFNSRGGSALGPTLVENNQKLRDKMGLSKPLPPEVFNPELGWPTKKLPFDAVSWITRPDVDESKRTNPKALAVRNNPIDVIALPRATVKNYTFSERSQTVEVLTGGGTEKKLSVNLQSRDLVLVSAVFPYDDQVTEFCRALRCTRQKLLEMRAIPVLLGMDVKRLESSDGGNTWSDPISLYTWKGSKEPKEHFKSTVDEGGKTSLPTLFRESLHVSEMDFLARLAESKTYLEKKANKSENEKLWLSLLEKNLLHTYPGMTTPLVQLENSQYPLLGGAMPPPPEIVVARNGDGPNQLPKGGGGILKGGKNPPMANPEEKAFATQDVKWKDVPKLVTPELEAQFTNSLFLLHFNGKLDPKGNEEVFGPGKKPFQKEPMQGDPAKEEVFPDALISFLDVVEPGKTYYYKIKIHIKSPNYQKTKDVAFQNLADKFVLDPAQETETPKVSIHQSGSDYFLYVTDSKPLAGHHGETRPFISQEDGLIPMQIHRWLNNLSSGEIVTGWVVGERFLVRPGEIIGKRATVETPFWSKTKSGWDLHSSFDNKTKKKVPGTPNVDFRRNPPLLLVDFQGGKVTSKIDYLGFQGEKRQLTVSENTSFEALILDGNQLIVHQSRQDTDDPNRLDRFNGWLRQWQTIWSKK